MTSRIVHAARWLLPVFVLSLPGAAATASEGTLVQGSTVYAVEDLGGSARFLETYELQSVQALLAITELEDAWLAIARLDGDAEPSVVRFSRETGLVLSSTPLTLPVGSPGVSTLEADPGGSDPWVLLGDETLGRLDPVDGTVTDTVDLARESGGLTWADGILYTLTEGESFSQIVLGRIDPESGAVDAGADLDDVVCLRDADLDFDDEGILHVASANHSCSVILPAPDAVLVSYRLVGGDAQRIAFTRPPQPYGAPQSLSARGTVSPIAVPLGLPTTVGLLLGLLGAGWLILRVRSV